MNTLDIIVVIVLVLSAGFAYMRGFVREVLSIVAWLGAAVIALFGYPHVAPLIGFLPPGAIRNGAAGAAIFIVALIVLSIITGTVAHRVSQSGLSSIDRVFGLLFGLARGAVLLCLAYIALTWSYQHQPLPQLVTRARSKPLLEMGRNVIQGWAPELLGNRHAKATASDASGSSVGHNFDSVLAPQPVAEPAPKAPTYTQQERRRLDGLAGQAQTDKDKPQK